MSQESAPEDLTHDMREINHIGRATWANKVLLSRSEVRHVEAHTVPVSAPAGSTPIPRLASCCSTSL